jgi:hypothetical protein
MGCCQAKPDQTANIDYGNDNDDELPRFDIQPKAKGGVSNFNNDKTYSGITPDKGLYGDNPKYNKPLDQENTVGERLLDNNRDNNYNTRDNRDNTRDNNNRNEDFSQIVHNGGRVNDPPINYKKYLYLTIKESKHNPIGTQLEITPLGLTNSKRNANDGVVYFGLHSLDFKNDFLFKAEEGVNKQHMEVKFDRDRPGYYVKNLNGSGVFIKIQDYLNLKNGVIISFGTNHLLVTIDNNDSLDQREVTSIIKFKAIYGPNKGFE